VKIFDNEKLDLFNPKETTENDKVEKITKLILLGEQIIGKPVRIKTGKDIMVVSQVCVSIESVGHNTSLARYVISVSCLRFNKNNQQYISERFNERILEEIEECS